MFYTNTGMLERPGTLNAITTPQRRQSFFLTGLAACFLTALLLFGAANNAQASHYRYGNIRWSRPNSTSKDVTFVITQGWRKTFFTSGTLNVGDVVSATSALAFGDNTSANINITVTSVNTAEDYFTGTATIVHTYPSLTTYTPNYSNCCRLSTLQNNHDENFASQTIVNLGTSNLESPTTTLPVIVNVPDGVTAYTFNVPAVDPDGSALTYRLATLAEYGGPTPCPGLSINSSTGVATINTSAVGFSPNQLYNGAFTITDASGATTITDFIMKIVTNANPPSFDYSVTPTNSFSYSISPGQNLNFTIKADETSSGGTVSISAAGTQTGMTFSPTLPTTATQSSSTTFNWTPTSLQTGSYVMSFVATNNSGIQATTLVTINVNANPIFVSPTPTQNANRLVITGSTVTDVIKAQSPGGFNTQILSVSGLPAGATITPSAPTAFGANATVTLSWTPTVGQWGPHLITFVAKDANNASTTYSYTLSANSIPVFTSTPITTAYTCTPYTYNIKYADADSASGDMLLYEHSTLPYWLTFTDNHDGSGVLSGTPPASENGNASIVSFTAADVWHHSSAAVVQNFTISVQPETIPPIFTAPADILLTGYCSSQTVTLGSPTGISDNCTITQTPTNNAPSSFPIGVTTVTWTVKDAYNNAATRTQTVTITTATVNSSSVVSVPYTVSGQQIQTIYMNYPVGAPTNQSQTITVGATGGTNSYAYAWEKSTANNATLAAVNGNATNSYTFAPSLSDISGNDNNIFTFKATITDTHGCTTSQTKKINVVNPWVSGGNAQICHKVAVRGGTVTQVMIVPQAQLAVHLGHNDGLGTCATFNGSKNGPGPMAPAQEVAVYPNPSTGMFVLEISYVTEPADIIVTDIQGRVVSTRKVAPTDDVSVSTIDLTGLAKGMYLVLVKEGDFRYQTKLVVR